ncbi:anti-sigma factor [Ochrobactrum pecoris]|nr:anti-sigma factor [Brucella pecoris]
MKSNLISDTELQAYADGFLSDERRQAVEAELLCDPSLKSEVAIWQRQNETLRALYAPVLDEPLPTRLFPDNINKQVLVARQQWWRMAAVVVFLVALGGLGGWFGRDFSGPAPTSAWPLVSEAMAAHTLYTSEIVHPVEVKAEQEQHLSAWLSKRLDRALTIPDLQAEGLSLVGGRLLPAQGGPAAQLMYEERGRQACHAVYRAVGRYEGDVLALPVSGQSGGARMDRQCHQLCACRRHASRTAPGNCLECL